MTKKEARNKQNEPPKKSVRGRIIVFAVVAGAVSGYLLVQARRNPPGVTAAPTGSASAPAGRDPSPPAVWSSGEKLPAVGLLSLSGDRLELRVSGTSRPTLLFIFSPTCSICTQTIPIWKSLYEQAQSRSIEVVGISVLDTVRTTEYVSRHQLPWNVFCAAGQDAVQALRVERVPMTLLVEGSGTVAEAMRGKLSDEQREQAERFIDGQS